MPKLTEHSSEVRCEHSDFLAVFHCASNSILASFCDALLFTFKSEVLAFCFIHFNPPPKNSTAFRIKKHRRFILENDFFKICIFVCVFFSPFTGSSGYVMCVQLTEHRGVCVGIRNVTTKPEFVSQDDLMHSHDIWIS